MSIRVLLVDDHAVVRQGLRAYLELQAGIEVCGEAGSAEQAIAMATALTPDVALVDLVMPGMGGIETTRLIRAASPATNVVILTSSTDPSSVRPALEAGATSYQLKEVGGSELVDCVRRAARGESVLHPRIAGGLPAGTRSESARNLLRQLSAREREVLMLIAEGLPNHAIAERLKISEPTVKTHVGNVLSKLEVADRTQAAVWAWRQQLLLKT